MEGLEAAAAAVADQVMLDVAYSPVMPVAGDLFVARRVEQAGIIGRFSVEPVFSGVTLDDLRLMRARFLILKGRIYDQWEEIDPELRDQLDKDFFNGCGPGPRLLPHGKAMASFGRDGSVLSCPTCGATEDISGADGATKMVHFIATHSRCGTGEASPLQPDFRVTAYAVPPPTLPTLPTPKWRIYAYDGKSPRGEQMKFCGGEEAARAEWSKTLAPKRGYVRLVGPDGSDLEQRP